MVARIVRDDEVGGSNPLAPTRLTDLVFEFDRVRQRRVEPQVHRVGRELELEALIAKDV